MRDIVRVFSLAAALAAASRTAGQCGPPGDCCAAHATPGCADQGCCAAVCAADLFCCVLVWDALCADEAAVLCDGCPAGKPPGNDGCAAALPLDPGGSGKQFPFTTVHATTDGPVHQDCSSDACAGDFLNHNDVWFSFTADFDGLISISTCGSVPFETTIAVYDGCDCADLEASFLACSQNAPDCEGPGATLFIPVTPGACHLIRVGSPAGQTGRGTLVLIPAPAGACPGPGSCQGSNRTPGCKDQACCEKVCAIDPFCCDVIWDSICAGEAQNLCLAGDCLCDLASDYCCDAHGTPGCDQPDCCRQVCGFDASCCDVAWDAACADLARHFCPEICPLLPSSDPDLDGDGVVGILDFLAVLAAWGPCPPFPRPCPADLDGDGAVGVLEFFLVLAGWT